MSEYRFSVVIGHDEDGYWGRFPEFQGCYTQGITFEGTMESLKEAIGLHLEDRLACGEEIPRSDTVSLLMLDVAV